MSNETLQEKFWRLHGQVAAGGGSKSRAADELLDILRGLACPDYGMGGPGFWVVEPGARPGDGGRCIVGPFADDDEALRWSNENTEGSWITMVTHPRDFER